MLLCKMSLKQDKLLCTESLQSFLLILREKVIFFMEWTGSKVIVSRMALDKSKQGIFLLG